MDTKGKSDISFHDDPLELLSSSSEDDSITLLQLEERKKARRSKIWVRQNIDYVENEYNKRKTREKMVIPFPVIDKIENNKFLLENLMEKTNFNLEEMGLIFNMNETNRKLIDGSNNQNRIFEVKKTLTEINEKFLELEHKWEETSMKEDILVMDEETIALREQSLKLIEQKDKVISLLIEGLEKLITQSINESLTNSDDLVKLNKIAKNQINILKEEHQRQNSIITKLYEEEKDKKNNIDHTKWTQLMEEIVGKISKGALNRLTAIQKKDLELIQQYEINEEDTKMLRIKMAEKFTGKDVDLDLVTLKCSENIDKLLFNVHILKKKINDNNITIIDKKRRVFKLREMLYKMKKEKKALESEYEFQIPGIKKQIKNIHEKINQQEKRVDSAAKKDNYTYLELWNLKRNDLIQCINEILKIDDITEEYLGIRRSQLPRGKPIIDSLPFLKETIDLLFRKHPPRENLIEKSYKSSRDKALNQILLDFIVKNSSFVFDNNIREMLNTCPMQNLPYAYNIFSKLKLNEEEHWNLMKSKFKPWVMCKVCSTRVSWELQREVENVDEQNHRSNITTSDECIKGTKSSKSLFEEIRTHITQHNENIENVKSTDSHHKLNNTFNQNHTIGNHNEQQNSKYSTNAGKSFKHTPQMFSLCTDLNHDLYVEENCFMFVIQEVLKETRPKPLPKPKSFEQRLQKKYNYIQWKITEKDLREYWSQFTNYIPNNIIDKWNIYYKVLKLYHDVLIYRKKKMTKVIILRKENEKLKKLKQQLEEYDEKIQNSH